MAAFTVAADDFYASIFISSLPIFAMMLSLMPHYALLPPRRFRRCCCLFRYFSAAFALFAAAMMLAPLC